MVPVGEERELSFWRRSRRLDRLIARYVVVLASVLGTVVLTFAALTDLDLQSRDTDAARFDVQRVLHAQADEQTGLSGFAATAKATYLQPYLLARRDLGDVLVDLQMRARDQPQVMKQLNAFAVRHEGWERSVAKPILSRPSGALNDDGQRAGEELLSGMRASIAAIDTYYAARGSRIERARKLVRYGSYALILIAILIVASYGYYSERSSARREERLLRSVLGQRDTATRQNEWRTKIIAILAHDFRTSLAVIQASAELLETHPVSHLTTNAFRAIYKGVADLAAMTDEALLMARVANHTLVISPAPVFIYDLIAEVADRFTSRQDIRISLCECYVHGDEAYLARAFDNVISNAVKYSNGPIDVSIIVVEKTVEIIVRDRGPGIDAADLPHVFEEYWRGESVKGKRGSGIGLYIVKKIVDAHQGTVRIDSAPGEGTSVRVILPKAEMSQPESDANEAAYD